MQNARVDAASSPWTSENRPADRLRFGFVGRACPGRKSRFAFRLPFCRIPLGRFWPARAPAGPRESLTAAPAAEPGKLVNASIALLFAKA